MPGSGQGVTIGLFALPATLVVGHAKGGFCSFATLLSRLYSCFVSFFFENNANPPVLSCLAPMFHPGRFCGARINLAQHANPGGFLAFGPGMDGFAQSLGFLRLPNNPYRRYTSFTKRTDPVSLQRFTALSITASSSASKPVLM